MSKWQTPYELDDAAARGAAELDRKLPSWAQMIDTERLDVVNAAHCIVGQLAEQGRFPWPTFDPQFGTSITIGAGWEDRLVRYERLTESWIAQIQMRTGIPVTDTIHEGGLVA